ncbi:MAG TPA: hypothetical protein ENL02_02355 [Epsilonproteobacteria bacterium]|nr:hypothetical protein [Campylobacterota bacterium]
MKKRVKITLVLVLGSTVLFAGPDQFKMYGVKSGKIDYKITGSGNMMGIETKTVGKKRITFKNYGAKSLTEENKVQKTVAGGKSTVEKSHTIAYMDGAMLYNVNFGQKRIIRMQNPAMAMMTVMGGGKSPMEMGEAMLKKIGGKKIGTDKVLGYTCDLWEAMGTKQCIYKGITLKAESNIMGMKNLEIATKAEFDLSISDDDFELPDFPVYDMSGNKLDKNSLASMDQKEKKEAAQSGADFAAARGAMAAATKRAGIKPGEKPTKAQEKDMEDAMISAMLPRMKQKMLAQEKVLQYGKECLGEGDKLKEANVCSRKMNEMSGEQDDDLTQWDEKTKKETLGFIDQGLAGVACVKKAETMDQMKECMGE